MPAHLLGLGAFQLALALALLDLRLAALPLAAFVLACAVAPFLPALRLFGPLLDHGRRDGQAVALTFDDGPDPSTTLPLLELLARHRVRAFFFVVGERAARHPALVRRLLAGGHGLGNHSASHDPLLMLRSSTRLSSEIASCQQVLGSHGVRPLAFRPPAGIVNPRLWPALLAQGLCCVGFSRRGLDFGNRRVAGLAWRLLRRVRPGDVLLLHDGPVLARGGSAAWLAEVEQLLLGLQHRGLAVRPLEELLGRPLVEPLADEATAAAEGAAVEPVGGPDPVAAFYDALAGGYDREQQRPSFTSLRRVEEQLVLPRLARLLGPGDRVLEIGAGTGRFTLALAERAQKVVAVELSAGMAGKLRAKLQQTGRGNVHVLVGDVRRLELSGPYHLICAFSACEYLRELGPLLSRLAGSLQPGGTLLLTTARRSPLRFFVQLGNALRQGVWLEARSSGELRRLLGRAGLEHVEISAHGLHVPPLHRGMLLLAEARRPGGGPEASASRGAAEACSLKPVGARFVSWSRLGRSKPWHSVAGPLDLDLDLDHLHRAK